MMFYVSSLFGKEELGVTSNMALEGLSRPVSHDRLNNPESSMERYVEQMIFFSVNGSSSTLKNIFHSSMRVNITAVGVVVSHCASNEISGDNS